MDYSCVFHTAAMRVDVPQSIHNRIFIRGSSNRRHNDDNTGWGVDVKNISFANGFRVSITSPVLFTTNCGIKGGPWREATMSSQNLSVVSTQLGDGLHCSDLITAAGDVGAAIKAVQNSALDSMRSWLANWKLSNSVPIAGPSEGCNENQRSS